MYEVEMRGITKTFPGVIADDNVDFFVRPGEIHALMGENGAGKSILMSMLAGLYQPDAGEIIIRGEKKQFHSPLDAISAGVGMVFQEFQLFGSMSIVENIVFHEEPVRQGRIDRAQARSKVMAIADKYGLDIDPDMKAHDAPVGILQRAEIIKALYREAKILILDEPTAVLTPQETDRLFEVLHTLREDGHTIIFITHKLREVMAISDRVTVLRDGKVTARLETAQTTPEEISRYMTGRDVDLTMSPATNPVGDIVLRVRDVEIESERDLEAVRGASLTVRAGEIVGIAGVAGNGQSELAEAIAGLRPTSKGSIEIAGKDVTRACVRERRQAGLAYIPENRQGVGSAPTGSATENLAMGHHRSAPIRPRRLLNRRAMATFARDLIERFSVRIAHENVAVGTLSGGNLQKILVAREMEHRSPLLIAEQPTRGVDIGAIEFIHRQLTSYRDSGGGVLLISAELSEIMSLSTRILVMYEGRIVAELPAECATEEKLGLLMAGGKVGD
ncbi:ABC transporter ATP-binding protein [Trueperella sp. LYQ143]|uniref:ABC transporter ATP-binding protein n=1 Tax=unclassified Trueperella TaxID=2630174 RepID=UPI00398306D2